MNFLQSKHWKIWHLHQRENEANMQITSLTKKFALKPSQLFRRISFLDKALTRWNHVKIHVNFQHAEIRMNDSKHTINATSERHQWGRQRRRRQRLKLSSTEKRSRENRMEFTHEHTSDNLRRIYTIISLFFVIFHNAHMHRVDNWGGKPLARKR